MTQPVDRSRVARAAVEAYARAARDRIDATRAASDPKTRESIRLALRPPKAGTTLRNTGIALMLAPEPITTVPGAVMIGASYAMKRREAAGLEDLVDETVRTLRELRSLRL